MSADVLLVELLEIVARLAERVEALEAKGTGDES